MKRSPGWSRAWDARTHVPSSFPMRDARQAGENKERRERGILSFFLLDGRPVVVRLSSRPRRAELTAPEIWSNVHALTGALCAWKKNARVRLPPTITCRNVPLPWFPPGHRSPETSDVRIFEMGSPPSEPITNLSEETSSKFMFARSSKDYTLPSGKTWISWMNVRRTFETRLVKIIRRRARCTHVLF